MGKMKEKFIDEIEKTYGHYRNYIKDVLEMDAQQLVREETLCPNCLKDHLLTNEDLQTHCGSCGQNFVRVGNAFRFE